MALKRPFQPKLFYDTMILCQVSFKTTNLLVRRQMGVCLVQTQAQCFLKKLHAKLIKRTESYGNIQEQQDNT